MRGFQNNFRYYNILCAAIICFYETETFVFIQSVTALNDDLTDQVQKIHMAQQQLNEVWTQQPCEAAPTGVRKSISYQSVQAKKNW